MAISRVGISYTSGSFGFGKRCWDWLLDQQTDRHVIQIQGDNYRLKDKRKAVNEIGLAKFGITGVAKRFFRPYL